MFHSFFKCQHTALVSLSFAAFLTSYFIFIIVLLIPQSTYAEVARVEQPIKNAVVRNDVIETMFNVQCSKIIGISSSIEKLSVSVTPDPNASAPLAFKAVIYKYTEGPNSPPALLRRSEVAYTGPKGVQNDVVFNFNSPIDVDGDICSNPGAYFSVYVSYAGTSTSNRSADFNGSLSNGMYYIFNGEIQHNNAPEVSIINNTSISEGDYSEFIIEASDLDQTGGLSYSLGPTPQGLFIVGNKLIWTPSASQAGIHNIEVRATDAGNGSYPPKITTKNLNITVNDSILDLERVEQPIKNVVVRNDVIETMFNVQCSKIHSVSGNIEKMSVSITPDPNASGPLAFKSTIYKYTEGPSSPTTQGRRSEVAYTGPKGVQNDVVFNFNSPIDVDGDICSNPGAYFSVYVSYAGTSTSNRTADFNGSATAGMYYVFNGHVLLNSSPILEPIGPKIVSEDVTLNFAASAIDPDNNTITYSATNLPIGATLNPTTGEFTWTPGYTDAGTYEVTFTATENTPEALFDSETITITVTNTNRAPELTTIGNQTISEGATLQFTVSATDPDNDTITLSATNLPTGATFTPSTGLFYWNTDFDEAGNYADIEFTATDNGIPMELDVELITITVGDVNRMPELSNPGPQVVLEEDTLSFTVSATDPDNDTVTLSASNLPTGATFNPTTGSFNWTPSLADAGVYTVTITATDNGTPVESATIDVVITVGDNPTPTEQAEDLVEIVITIDIPQNIENSYLANLHKVKQFILAGQITAALNQLQAFINKVQQDYNQNRLSQEEYDALIEAAENLMDDLMN